MGWGEFGYGMGIFGWLFMLIIWGLIILAMVVIVRWLWNQGRSGASTGATDGPLGILKRRYERGEIGREEYDRMKKDLT